MYSEVHLNWKKKREHMRYHLVNIKLKERQSSFELNMSIKSCACIDLAQLFFLLAHVKEQFGVYFSCVCVCLSFQSFCKDKEIIWIAWGCDLADGDKCIPSAIWLQFALISFWFAIARKSYFVYIKTYTSYFSISLFLHHPLSIFSFTFVSISFQSVNNGVTFGSYRQMQTLFTTCFAYN